MITHDARWSLPRGNTLVPSRWQATLRVDCWGAPNALPARTSQKSARNARNAHECGLRSFHGIPGQSREIRHSK